MTKYKLAPIEATEEMRHAWNTAPNNGCSYFKDELYKAMTAQCETVEVVDIKQLHWDNPNLTGIGFLKLIEENGYKIVKVCND